MIITASSDTSLGVLRLGDIDQGASSRVHNLQQVEDGGPVIGDGALAPGVHDQLVHAPRAESGAHSVTDHLTRIDVADQLLSPTQTLSAVFQQNYRSTLKHM